MRIKVAFNDDYTSRDKDYLKRVISFYTDENNFDMYDGTIYISFTDEIPHTTSVVSTKQHKSVTVHGLCVKSYKEHNVYHIYINSENTHTQHIKTIFHELCHALQYSTGKLQLDSYSRNIWDGYIPFPTAKVIEFSTYKNLPWEQEAAEHEEIYYSKWRDHESWKNKAANFIKSIL